MPRLVNLGVPYGTIAWPDDASDEQIVADFDALEADRQRAINRARLESVRLADIAQRLNEPEGRIGGRIALGVDAGLAAAPIALGNIMQAVTPTAAQIQATGQTAPEAFKGELRPGAMGFPTGFGLNAATIRAVGKRLVETGRARQEEARYQGEQLGGGVPGAIAGSLAETAAVSAQTLPVAAVGGLPAAAVAAGLQSYGLNKEQFRDQLRARQPNLPEDELDRIAEKAAVITGTITGALTRTFGGVERFVADVAQRGLRQQGIKQILDQVLKSAYLEFPEEGLDQLAQGITEKAYVNPQRPVSDILNEAVLAGGAGFALGGLTTGGIAGVTKAAEAVGGRVEEGFLRPRRERLESARASEERIKQVIAEREAQDAQRAREETQAPSQPPQVLEQEEEERVRLRRAPQDRVETVPGTPVTPPAPTPTAPVPPVEERLLPAISRAATGRPVNWQAFVTGTSPDRRSPVDWIKLRAEVQSGNVDGGEAGNALLLHLLQRSDLHPTYVELVDIRPQAAFRLLAPKSTVPFVGRILTPIEGPRAPDFTVIQVLTRYDDEQTVSQLEFVRILNHELIHNNVTNKIHSADASTKQDLEDLFEFVQQAAQGTEWRRRNPLKNSSEFLAEAFTDASFQRWLTSLDYSGRIRRIGGKPQIAAAPARNSVFRKLLEIIKRILGLPDTVTDASGNKIDIITALDQAISLGHKLEQLQFQRPPAPTVQLSPVTPPTSPAVQAPGPPATPEQALVSAGAAEVGRVAEQIYNNTEAGGRALEALAYERRQYRMARAELKRLTDLAIGRFRVDGIGPEMIEGGYPDPMEEVGIEDGQVTVGDAFVNKLGAAGMEFNPENVMDMQAQVFFENAAHRLNNLRRKQEVLFQAIGYYEQLGVEEEEIKKVQTELTKITDQIDKLGSAVLENSTVGQRAGEMEQAQASRQQNMSLRDALSLEPVNEFFGKHVGDYRAFTEKLDHVAKTVEALRDKATDPAEAQRLTEELAQWVRIPEDIQRSLISGKPLTDEQRASIFASLAEAFEDFDIQRARMREMRDTKVPLLDAKTKDLMAQMPDHRIAQGMKDVLLADVRDALEGVEGGTGTLQSQEIAQQLKNQLSAINSFAETIGRNIEQNQDLFNWLTNPTDRAKFMVSASQAYGVDQRTLSMILEMVRQNPDFGSAVLNLIEQASGRLANLPVAQLERIREMIKGDDQQGASLLARNVRAQARASASNATAALRGLTDQVDAAEIERGALEQGNTMFEQLGANPEFQRIREAVANSPYGFVEPMVLQNNTGTTFKSFSIPSDEKGDLSDKGFVMGARDNPVLKAEWFQRTARWYKAAQRYIDRFDHVLAFYQADPDNNPSPESLGFDLAKVRGLRDAVQRFVKPSFLDLSLLAENKRWKVPDLVRVLSKSAWFRQHDFVSKMVGGATGLDLRARLADFVSHYLEARAVMQKYQDIPDLFHHAMRSHPQMQMNMAEYRKFWNELAHWGRQFGSPVAVGYELPLSGIIVTKEDMALLRRQVAFEEDLRRRVTETNPVSGIRVKRGERDLVRSGAFVGDYGLPRHLNRQADTFISDVIAAYGEPAGLFSANSDLGPGTAEPIPAFWNRNIPLLIQHIYDTTRADRTMRQTAQMAQAERDAVNDWAVNGRPTIDSLERLVTELAKYYPPGPGINVRDKVIEGLNAELKQYRDAAKGIANERAEAAQARHSKVTIPFSAVNEFTQPAAKLELPSAFYDYGALTPSEHLTILSRANHERVVGYATAITRAIEELQDRVNRVRNKEITEEQAAKSYGGDFDELKEVLGILQKIGDDFEKAYRLGSPALTQSQWYREGFGTFTSAVLALPTVGLRNMTQGQFEAYLMSQALGLSGHEFLMRQALKNMVKTVTRAAVNAGTGLAKTSDYFASMLTGQNIKIFERMVDGLAKLVFLPDYRASNERVNQLGYDTRDRFLDRMTRIWQETAETATPEEVGKRRTVKIGGQERQVAKLAGLPVKALRAAFDKLGVQQYDLAINATLLTYAEFISRRLEEVAMNYGANREALGLTQFDVTDPRFLLKPDEWAAYGNEKQNEDSLAFFRTFLEGSAAPEGFQLESALWNYYQAAKAAGGKVIDNPKIFTDRQFDAVQRRMLAEFNASTPANRASAAAGNPLIRNLLTLQGYVSDGLLKLVNAFGAIRDRGTMAQTLSKLPILANLAFMSLLIGMFASSLTGEWEKRVRGRLTVLPNPLDKDFWSSFGRFADGSIRLALAQLFYVGDLALLSRGEVQGNRGFDPVGRIFPISVVTRLLKTAQGSWNIAKETGYLGDALKPWGDFGRSMVPYWAEAENAFGQAMGYPKQAERLLRGEAQQQGLLPQFGGAFQGPLYGPTTIMRRNLGEAVSDLYEARERGDSAAAQAAIQSAKTELNKLIDYHAAKYIEKGDDPTLAQEKATRDVWNDYQEINPAVAGLMGRRPTQAQYEALRGAITGERGRVVEAGIRAWQQGAQELFGREGTITREEVGAARGGPRRPRLVSPGQAFNVITSNRARRTGGPRMVRVPTVGYLRPARPARAVSRRPRARQRRLRVGPAPRLPSYGPTITRPRTRLGRLRRLNRRNRRRMNRRQTYVFE